MLKQFETNKDNKPITFVNGKIAFAPNYVKYGDWYFVEVIGQHTTKKVTFIKLIDNFSARKEVIGNIGGYQSLLLLEDDLKPVFETYKDISPFQLKMKYEIFPLWQTWRFRIDFEQKVLLPIERIMNEREQCEEKGKVALALLKSFVPKELVKHLSLSFPENKNGEWSCFVYGFYDTFKIDAVMLNEDKCQALVDKNLEMWNKVIADQKPYPISDGGCEPNFCHEL
jgi:hypothetical protein